MKDKMKQRQTIFKSKPFFKKIDSINSDFISKYIFYIFMMCILSISLSLLVGFGFSNTNSTALTLRAISIFCILWFIVFFIWWIQQTIYYFKLSTNKNKWLEILSFLPIFNLVSIIRLSKAITNLEFRAWLFNLFSKNNFENNANNYFSKKWYLNLTSLIIMTPFLVFLWFPEGINLISFYKQGNVHDNMWFEGFHYFTIQTNLLCYLYLLLFVINPRIKFFNNDGVLICLLSYLFIVSVTYNFALLPTNASKAKSWPTLKWVKTCWEHMVNPVIFITIGIYNMFYTCKKSNKNIDYLSTLKFGMIIPSIYLCYVLVLPFASNLSVYGFITNVNPNLNNNSSIMPNGEWYMVFCIIGYWFVFIGIITMFWRIQYSFYTRIKNQLKENN